VPSLSARTAIALVAGLAVLLASSAASQTLQRVPVRRADSLDGRVLYDSHCAACHGRLGRGDGSAALVFTAPIPDLSRICARDGWYDPGHVRQHLVLAGSHGQAMPEWARLFRAAYGPAQGQVVMANLARYVGTLQITP
jgi:hypothetical protein